MVMSLMVIYYEIASVKRTPTEQAKDEN